MLGNMHVTGSLASRLYRRKVSFDTISHAHDVRQFFWGTGALYQAYKQTIASGITCQVVVIHPQVLKRSHTMPRLWETSYRGICN